MSDFCTHCGMSSKLVARLTAELAEKNGIIEDLDRHQDIHYNMIQILAREDSHRITPKQIDTAWKVITDQEEHSWDPAVQCLEDVLKPLGIERCEECGGATHIEGQKCKHCPTGHGWVKKPPGVTHKLEGHATISLAKLMGEHDE